MYHLICHPDAPSSSVSKVTAQVCFGDDLEIWVEFMITPIEGVIFPNPKPAQRSDGLWKSTCFELFLKLENADRYFEFNLSPSSEWAAYSFDSYRSGMQNHPVKFDPEMEFTTTIDKSYYWLAADLPIPETEKSPFLLGLSAVIEEQDGHKSYWALAHPDGPPDFHNRDCFIAHLPPVEAP